MKSSDTHEKIGHDWQKVSRILESAPSINRDLQVPITEFKRRQNQLA